MLRCVLSVQSQFHALMMNPVARRIAPDFIGDAAKVEAWADHIASFSLSGMSALRSA